MIIDLLPFKGSSPINVSVTIQNSSKRLITSFFMTGDINLPEISGLCGRGDKLYTETCFEVFIKGEGEEYFEYNLSPSGLWDGFSFFSYRKLNKTFLIEHQPIKVVSQQHKGKFEFTFEIDLSKFSFLSHKIFVSPTMVYKKGAEVLYFSGCHSENKPDFHAPKSFIHSLILL